MRGNLDKHNQHMKVEDWMDAGTACAVLGVRRQTLYAYVSRGLLRAISDPGDPRKSLYERADVTRLAAKHRRPRARADVAAAAIRWGDPVLDTAISDVREGTLYFGARVATELAVTHTLEDVAAFHWGVGGPERPGSDDLGTGATPMARAMSVLSMRAQTASPLSGRGRADIAQEGWTILADVASACAPRTDATRPVHLRLSDAWGASADGADMIRQALVLISDHDLNPSTFAVRVCASTGASLPAALLAGLATLSGPRHGGAGAFAARAIRAGQSDKATRKFLAAHAKTDPYRFGFGHPHYPEGDARAKHLFAALGAHRPARKHARRVADHLGLEPNIDAALAAIAHEFDLPEDAGFLIFAVGRCVGWIAHAIEQVECGEIIRPKARFVGPVL